MARVGLSELANLARVIASGRLMHGDERTDSFTRRFETGLCATLGVSSALTVNSGTSALVLALAAAGVGPGDEVLIPAFTWVSTAAAPLALGAFPVLVDIDETLGMSPDDLRRKVTPRARAVIPVHMMNLVCDMASIGEIARANGLVVVEDACQALGVRYRDRFAGTIGDVGAYSFNHYKTLSGGEGGALVTNDARLAHRARVYHDVGTHSGAYRADDHGLQFTGLNYRVSELTGAVLSAQLPRLAPRIQRMKARREWALARLTKAGPGSGRPSPHNDPRNAVGLTFLFDTPAEAVAHAARHRDEVRIIDLGKYAYTDWLAVLVSAQARRDGASRADDTPDYAEDSCPATLDILSRTCFVSLA